MFYSFPLELPANTLERSPVESKVSLNFGAICYVEIEFPSRCVGLAKVRVLHRRRHLWPTNPDGWFYTDGKVIKWDEYYELFELPFELTLQGYNDDDTFPHTPIVRMNVLPPLVALAKYGGAVPTPTVRHIPWEEL